jgi:antitoxin component YwqK of YwqJK toxin-antitoxin module
MKVFTILTFLLLPMQLMGQLDTLKYQTHPGLSKTCVGSKCKYFLNGKSIKKADYEKREKETSAIENCTPCYLITYDCNGNFLYEGEMNGDCCIGVFITRYSSGQIKLKAQYKVPTDKNMNDPYNNGFCRPDGEWIYYNADGSVQKKEVYKNGSLVN